jgi:tRNA 2-thiocytidine biosynthesis protein TtcA
MLREWDKKEPGRLESIFNALGRTVPSHLMDKRLFDFDNLRATGVASEGGDIGFDVDPDLEAAVEAAAADAPNVIKLARV